MPDKDGLDLSADQLAEINRFVQTKLREAGKVKVGAIEAAGWLDSARLLNQGSRPGVNLRKLLREGLIEGGRQEPPGEKHGSWFVGAEHND